MNWIVANWFWILIGAAFIAFHLFGHGGHGGHGGHADAGNADGNRGSGQSAGDGSRRQDADAARPGGHQH